MNRTVKPDPKAKPTTCPRCGGELEFTSDPLRYGLTIEQCVNVLKCGHWTTLETIRRPAHTRPPSAEEVLAPRRARAHHGTVSSLLIAALPTSPDSALPASAVAGRAGHAIASVHVLLRNLRAAGRIEAVNDARPGKRAIWRYWRKAA